MKRIEMNVFLSYTIHDSSLCWRIWEIVNRERKRVYVEELSWTSETHSFFIFSFILSWYMTSQSSNTALSLGTTDLNGKMWFWAFFVSVFASKVKISLITSTFFFFLVLLNEHWILKLRLIFIESRSNNFNLFEIHFSLLNSVIMPAAKYKSHFKFSHHQLSLHNYKVEKLCDVYSSRVYIHVLLLDVSKIFWFGNKRVHVSTEWHDHTQW